MWPPSYVFLSYRSFEREFAVRLAGDLRNAGVAVWMDALEGGIEGGDEWAVALQNAVDGCAGMICVLSPDYVTSKYCRRELHRVDERGVPIIPILLRTLDDPRDRPLEIEGLQHLDFQRWQDERHYDRQYRELRVHLERKLSGVCGSPPDRETQYLTSLLAEVTSTSGVLEYTELGSEILDPETRPPPRLADEWGYSLLDLGGRAWAREFSAVGDILRAHPRFVLLGAPGAGKSTALRRLARAAALDRRHGPRTRPLPLLMSLAHWERRTSALDFVRSRWPFTSDPAAAIRDGEVILFLDGLNEMGHDGPPHAARLRDWMESADGPKSAVVTCRAADYEQLRLGELPAATIRELEPAQIRRFVHNYLESRAPAFLRDLGLGDDDRFVGAGGLLGLARNPYFLRSLIELFATSSQGDLPFRLPRGRGVLFGRLTQALWERERQRRTPDLVPLEMLRSRLARLARAVLENERPLQVPVTYASRKLTRWFELPFRPWRARRLLHCARSASLLQLDGDSCGFTHQLVHEYFAALSLAQASERAMARNVERWLADYRGIRYEDTLVTLSGLVDDPDRLVRQLLARRPTAAGRCVASGVAVSPALRREVVEALVAIVRQGNDVRGHLRHAVEALGLIGGVGPDVVVALGDLLRQGGLFVASEAARALGRIGTAAAAGELRRAVDDPGSRLSEYELFDALVAMGEPAVADLIDLLEDERPKDGSKRAELRFAAMRALAQVGQAAAPALRHALRTRTGAVRAGSAELLGKLGAVDAVPEMLEALASVRAAEPWRWKYHHELAFKSLGDSAVEPVVEWLDNASPERRSTAARALGAIGTNATLQHLARALQDASPPVREAASGSLGSMGQAALPTVLHVLDRRPERGAAEAAAALRQIKDARAVPALVALLASDDPAARKEAALALEAIGDPSTVEALLGALDDNVPEVRIFAARGLGKLGSVKAVAALTHCLTLGRAQWTGQTGTLTVNLPDEAALAIEQIGSPEALEVAKQHWREVLVNDPHGSEAAKALGRLRDRGALPLLIEASRRDYFWVRNEAVEALGLLEDASAVPAIVERLHDAPSRSGDVRVTAIDALGRLKDPTAVAPLAELLGETGSADRGFGDDRICDRVARTLETIATDEASALAVTHWRQALGSDNVRTRLLAAEALGRLRQQTATPELIAALADHADTGYSDERTVGGYAAEALEAIGGPETIEALCDHWTSELASERVRGRVEAIRGLGRIHCPGAVTRLIPRLEDSYSYEGRYVADYAAEVLEELATPEARVALAEYRDWRRARSG